MTLFAKGFGSEVCQGESITGELEGFTVTAIICRDDNHGAPWKENDCHGKVSDWTTRDKRPGERVLCSDRGSKRFYDWQEAIERAHKEGWGTKDGRQPGETLRQYRARAVQKDFEFLQGWCNDEWYWVGVDVEVSKMGIELTESFEHALWGIDSLSGEHCTEVAEELAVEAVAKAKEKLLRLLLDTAMVQR